MGRLRPVVTLRDLSTVATCYADSSGRVRPEADIENFLAPQRG